MIGEAFVNSSLLLTVAALIVSKPDAGETQSQEKLVTGENRVRLGVNWDYGLKSDNLTSIHTYIK